jgi:GAF domain-containing protein
MTIKIQRSVREGAAMSTKTQSFTPLELDFPSLEQPVSADPPPSGDFLSGVVDPSAQAAKLAIAESLFELLTRDLPFDEFVREVLLAVVRVFRVEAGTIFELDRNTGSLFFRAVSGEASHSVRKFRVPLGKGIVGDVAQTRLSRIVDDVSGDALHIKAIAAAVGFEVRNIVAVPLVIRGELYGVLELLNRVGERGFTPEDLETLEAACSMASRVLEARLVLGWALQEDGRAEFGEEALGEAA